MDSITYAAHKAIVAADKAQRATTPEPTYPGLQPLACHRDVHAAYAGAEGTDLHISLGREAWVELLALQMEMIAAGFTPPASLATEGCDVIISPGEVHIHSATDKGDATWIATLSTRDTGRPDYRKRTGWSEQVV
jgi:hypothetical protein